METKKWFSLKKGTILQDWRNGNKYDEQLWEHNEASMEPWEVEKTGGRRKWLHQVVRNCSRSCYSIHT